MDQSEVNVPSSSGTLIFEKLSHKLITVLGLGTCIVFFQDVRFEVARGLYCYLWLVPFVLGCGVDTNQCTGLFWDQSYLLHLSVFACMSMCTQMLDLPHCLWCTCIWRTNYTRCFKTCSDHSLFSETRMSYSELFLMFFPQIYLVSSQALAGGIIGTCWHFFWIQGLMLDNNSCNSTHSAEPFSACCFCCELCQKQHWILNYLRSCQVK